MAILLVNKEFMMIRSGIKYLVSIICFTLLCACATQSPPKEPSTSVKRKNLEFSAVLSDPVIKSDFRNLRKAAISARVSNIDGKPYLAEQDVKKLNELSSILIDRLENHYHLNAKKHKIHTFIGKNQSGSCYQYYNSLATYSVGKTCEAFPKEFGSCQLCDEYVKAIRVRAQKIIHSHWWNNERTTTLIDTFKLKNGDSVYLGLELSSS